MISPIPKPNKPPPVETFGVHDTDVWHDCLIFSAGHQSENLLCFEFQSYAEGESWIETLYADPRDPERAAVLSSLRLACGLEGDSGPLWEYCNRRVRVCMRGWTFHGFAPIRRKGDGPLVFFGGMASGDDHDTDDIAIGQFVLIEYHGKTGTLREFYSRLTAARLLTMTHSDLIPAEGGAK